MLCIRFYCDIKPTNKTLVPWLAGEDYYLHDIVENNVCMKLFNMASLKFVERGGTTCN
jgi:hypothetical protein